MRTFRAYCPGNSIEIGQNYQLAESTKHHLQKVLRMSSGDTLEVFDGMGKRYRAIIESFKPEFTVKILEALESQTVSPVWISLMVAVGKGEKMDLIIQKATELGVAEIVPLMTSRVEVRLNEERWQKKQDHWREISINACEQSGLDRLPVIQAVQTINKACENAPSRLKLLLHPEAGVRKLWEALSQPNEKRLSLLIGPEGGFDERELSLAKEHQFQCVSLGPRILRMETAAISAVTLAQAALGDL